MFNFIGLDNSLDVKSPKSEDKKSDNAESKEEHSVEDCETSLKDIDSENELQIDEDISDNVKSHNDDVLALPTETKLKEIITLSDEEKVSENDSSEIGENKLQKTNDGDKNVENKTDLDVEIKISSEKTISASQSVIKSDKQKDSKEVLENVAKESDVEVTNNNKNVDEIKNSKKDCEINLQKSSKDCSESDEDSETAKNNPADISLSLESDNKFKDMNKLKEENKDEIENKTSTSSKLKNKIKDQSKEGAPEYAEKTEKESYPDDIESKNTFPSEDNHNQLEEQFDDADEEDSQICKIKDIFSMKADDRINTILSEAAKVNETREKNRWKTKGLAIKKPLIKMIEPLTPPNEDNEISTGKGRGRGRGRGRPKNPPQSLSVKRNIEHSRVEKEKEKQVQSESLHRSPKKRSVSECTSDNFASDSIANRNESPQKKLKHSISVPSKSTEVNKAKTKTIIDLSTIIDAETIKKSKKSTEFRKDDGKLDLKTKTLKYPTKFNSAKGKESDSEDSLPDLSQSPKKKVGVDSKIANKKIRNPNDINSFERTDSIDNSKKKSEIKNQNKSKRNKESEENSKTSVRRSGRAVKKKTFGDEMITFDQAKEDIPSDLDDSYSEDESDPKKHDVSV